MPKNWELLTFSLQRTLCYHPKSMVNWFLIILVYLDRTFAFWFLICSRFFFFLFSPYFLVHSSCSCSFFNQVFWKWKLEEEKNLNKKYTFLFKGGVSRDFRPQFFFHKSNPSGPLINRLKWFFIKIRFREDIWIFFEKLAL